MHATFFIASDFLDGGTMWNDAVIEVVREAPGQQLNLVRSGFGHHDVGSLDKRRALIQTLIGALKYLPPAERLGRVCSMARRFTPLMLSTDQVLALHRAGMAIGAHTASHPILSALPDAQARTEIAAGRAALEQIIQAPVRLFAYPNGKPGQDFEERHAEMLREQGFDAAVTTAWGAARSGSDPFRLPRFTPWDRSAPGFLLRMARNLMTHPA